MNAFKFATAIVLASSFSIPGARAEAEAVFEKEGVYSSHWAESAGLSNNGLSKFQVLELGDGEWIKVRYQAMPPIVRGENDREVGQGDGRLKAEIFYITCWINTKWIVTVRRIEEVFSEEIDLGGWGKSLEVVPGVEALPLPEPKEASDQF